MTTTSSTTSSTMTSLGFISPTQLYQMMKDNPCAVQVIDSRSFLNYNAERITGSINIYCPPLVKRRFQSQLPLSSMLTRESKAMLCRATVHTVVVHDQLTDEALFRTGQSDLKLLLLSLVQFLGQRNYLVLAGGYFRFRQEWPSMCSSHTSLSGQLCHVTRHCSSPKQIFSPKSPNTIQALNLTTTKTNNIFSLTPVELLPYLYIGDAGHSSKMDLLRKFHITAILNVSTSCENHFPNDFRYKVIPVEDSSSANLLEWFQSSILFIEHERKIGGKVLVHCHGGISRSATVCLAYLMYTRHLILDEAFEYVKSRRHIISPNANFMMQLSQFEQELRNLGFMTSAKSLQMPLSPRKLSSVASCPDMSRFMMNSVHVVETKEQEEEEEDENGDEMEEEEEEYRDKVCGQNNIPDSYSKTERLRKVSDADNNNDNSSMTMIRNGSGGITFSYENNDNISNFDRQNGNGMLHNSKDTNQDSVDSINEVIGRSTQYSNLQHNTPYAPPPLAWTS